MKVSTLFDLIADSSDLLSFFDKVDSPEQLVSRLERLKRQGVDEFLSCIEGLRAAITTALHDTLELSPSLEDPSSEEAGGDSEDDDLDKLLEEEEEENPIPPATDVVEKVKNVAPDGK